jgi:hypothetical protein
MVEACLDNCFVISLMRIIESIEFLGSFFHILLHLVAERPKLLKLVFRLPFMFNILSGEV